MTISAPLFSAVHDAQHVARLRRWHDSSSRSSLRSVTFSDVEESFHNRDARPSANHSLNADRMSVLSADTLTSGTTEYFSADEGAFSADEFFDLPQDEDEDGDDASVENGVRASSIRAESDAILELFRVVDDKLEGSGEEQEEALSMLRQKEMEVGWIVVKKTRDHPVADLTNLIF